MKTTFILPSFIAVSSFVALSAFNAGKQEKKPVVSSYAINLVSKTGTSSGERWTWQLINPNPGNGNNGTLQDVSHWSMAIPPEAEAALVSAEYSRDGVNWFPVPIEVERDPSIRICTSIDVLKFDVGTIGTDPIYYRATFSEEFQYSAYATSYIKTGGGLKGCNLYYFGGIGSQQSE